MASLGIGVAMTAAYSVAGALLPADAHVTGFGIMTTASLVGLAFSPVLAGFVGAPACSVVFVVDVLLLMALGIAVLGAEVPEFRSSKAPPFQGSDTNRRRQVPELTGTWNPSEPWLPWNRANLETRG